ncbi:MAG TPA: hypothetical protein DEP35_20120 [Deltaproteobacteria bacterium]|nr:hypothetical protein [Deltaproteobacteria bacterium]
MVVFYPPGHHQVSQSIFARGIRARIVDERGGAWGKFCEACAAPLGQSCTSCGTELSPSAKFCDECDAEVQSGIGGQRFSTTARAEQVAREIGR